MCRLSAVTLTPSFYRVIIVFFFRGTLTHVHTHTHTHTHTPHSLTHSRGSRYSPDELYNRTITAILQQRNLTIDKLLTDPYMVGHTMFNVLRDGNLSQEAIDACVVPLLVFTLCSVS